jgi:hypothetical protein
MLEITPESKTRSTNRRHAALSVSPNRESLLTRITPAEGNETETSSWLVGGQFTGAL